MQNIISKFTILIIFFGAPALINAQNAIDESLMIADSLFQEKKYTESYEIYESIFQRAEKYSPSMLLKMAFIKEGLGDYSMALYYLDYYYLKTSNRRVLKKMEELAEQNQLSGYDYSDLELLISYWHKYHIHSIMALMILSFILLSYYIFTKRRGSPSFSTLVFLILILMITGILMNFGLEKPSAIIIADNTYIMEDPSSASDLIEIVKKGHKVKIKAKQDVWYEIEWNDADAWIREGNLILIRQ